MNTDRKTLLLLSFASSLIFCALALGQPPSDSNVESVRLMTIPISIFTKTELKKDRLEEFVAAGNLKVVEQKKEQEILSIRSVNNHPLAIAILLQDDLETRTNLQLNVIKEFIRDLPPDSRVMVAYLRSGKTQIRQKFTRDLDAAADSLRVISGSTGLAPRSPFESLRNVLKEFDGLPNGRRAVFMVSDGVDVANGITNSNPGLNNELERAIKGAQERGIAVYTIYSPASLTKQGNRRLVQNGQGSLNRLSDRTGGRAYFQGFGAPVSFRPFLRSMDRTLTRQFALTYLSTHMDSGYYRVKVESSNPSIKIDHPKGYYFKKPKRR